MLPFKVALFTPLHIAYAKWFSVCVAVSFLSVIIETDSSDVWLIEQSL